MTSIKTSDLAFCFADCIKDLTESKIKQKLGKVSQTAWLKPALSTKGTRGKGGTESQWNALIFGGLLHTKFQVPLKTIRARFQTKLILAPYLETWKTYEAENFVDT